MVMVPTIAGPFGFPLLDLDGPCPMCGAPVVRPLHVYANPKQRVAKAEELVLAGCESCGIVFSHPLPTDAELDAFYAGGREGWEGRRGMGEQAADGEAVERKLEVKRGINRRQRDGLLSLMSLSERPDGEAPRVFDFGAGIGAWLDVFAEAGWQTLGLEPGEASREITGRRHAMTDTVPSEPTFDLVILHHVLEHLRNPRATLEELAAATREGGYVFISSPDFGRVGIHEKLGYVASAVHIFSYTLDGLRSLLALTGFEVVEHLHGPAWDRRPDRRGFELKVLARRVATPAVPGDEPLRQAKEGLRAYGEARRRLRASTPPPTRAQIARQIAGHELRRLRKRLTR